MYNREYYQKNRSKLLKQQKKYRKKNRISINLKKNIYRKQYPWIRVWENLNQRCNNVNNTCYERYGAKGIQNLLTKEEIKKLMIRDNYWDLKRPSIDRINPKDNYIFENCQFIEFESNVGKDRKKPVLQFDLEGNFIREWESLTQVSKVMNTTVSNISSCCKQKSKTAIGFTWRYKY